MRTMREKKNTLDAWIMQENNPNDNNPNDNNPNDLQYGEHYEMPRRLDVREAFRKIYDIQPQNYEQLISIPGIGPAAIRALSLIGEIIFGTKHLGEIL